MRHILYLLLVLSLAFSAAADEKDNAGDNTPKPFTLTINGTVTDVNTGETLVGVEVKLEGTEKKTYTDFDGHFEFNEVLPGKYDISANYISYEKQKLEKQNIDVFSSQLKVQLVPTN